MTKKITFKNSKVLGYLLILLGLFGSSAYNQSQAQAPYCSAPSSYSPCSGLNMYIGTVRVAQGSNVIFNKANDGCNTTSGGYTLMSTTPSFTLNGGSNYTMSFNTGPNYAVNIGVWVDLNRDNDFTDAGEYLSTGWAQINGRDEISIAQKVQLEQEYLNRKSFLFDIEIIIKTFTNVLFRKGVSH